MLTLRSLMILSLSSKKLNYLETLEPMLANGMLRITTIAVSLTCSDNFWQSLEVLLINCKVELKVKWTKYCVFSVVGNDKNDGNSDNIVLIIKDTKMSLQSLCLQQAIKKYQNFLTMGLKNWCIGMNINKNENKNTTNEVQMFS